MPFSFAPYSLWPLAFVSISLLYFVLLDVKPARAARLGFVYGLAYFALGVYWIYYSVRLFGDAVAPLAIAMTALFVVVMAVFPCMSCALFAWLRSARQNAILNAFVFAGCWLGFELMRGWVFGGFPWLLVGYSQIDSVFVSFAPILGVLAISWVVVLLAACLVVLLLEKNRSTRAIVAVLLVVLTVSAAALSPIVWTQDRAETLPLRLIQGNIKQELKFSRERLDESLSTYIRLSEAAPDNTKLVIWPETAIPTLFTNVDKAIEPFVKGMTARGIDVLSGGFHRNDEGLNFNSFRQLGGERALYAKGHLVPFGEFMPFRSLLEPIAQFVQIPMSDLSAAPRPAKALRVQGESLGISICYEDVFGVEMRSTLPDASMLINVSNDAWFGDSSAPHQHQEMARMRAREFERSMVRVTNTGISSTIDYRGNVLKSIPFAEQGTIDASVELRAGATPYVTLGNIPVWVITALSLLAGYFVRRKRAQ